MWFVASLLLSYFKIVAREWMYVVGKAKIGRQGIRCGGMLWGKRRHGYVGGTLWEEKMRVKEYVVLCCG